jgi:Putative MetA-pathway of phenol degradation
MKILPFKIFRLRKNILLFIFFLSITNIAMAQEEIDTDRPDQTESPVTINKKWIQIEHGFNGERDNKISIFGSSTLLRYGLLKNVELRLETDFIYTPTTNFSPATTELQPVVLGTKISLWEEKKWIPKTSLLIDAGIPLLAARSFKNFTAQPGIKLVFQNNLSQTISWGYNAGVEWDGENASPYYIYTFSNGINLSKKLYGFLEVFGSVSKNDLPQHNFDAGFSLLINNNCKIDISSVAGLTKSAPDWSIAIGASVRFKAPSK